MIEAIALLLTSLGAAAGKTGVNQGVKILEQLIGLQEEQVRLLQAIDLKVDAILAGPMNTGVRQLQDALSVRNGPDYQALLKEARSSFTAALGQDPEPLRRSFAALYLASVWLLLGYPEHFKRHLQEAHFEAFRAIKAISDAPLSIYLRLSDILAEVMSDYTHMEGVRSKFDKVAPIASYANELAQVRQAWGTPLMRAPRLQNIITDFQRTNEQQWKEVRPHEIEQWFRAHTGDEP
jgi:hypothetical protein